MILKGCVMIEELARYSGYHPSRYYKKPYADKLIKESGKSFIPKTFLFCERDIKAASKCTNMDDLLSLPYCAQYLLGVSNKYLRYKIRFQRETSQKIYDVKKIQGSYFFVIPDELQEKIRKYVSYTVTDFTRFTDFKDVKDSYILGDNLIVFM